MIRVGIDCQPLQHGAAGVRTYLRNLVRELARRDDVKVTCFIANAFAAPELPRAADVRRVRGPWLNNWVWSEWQLPRAVAASGAALDLFHFPAYTASSRLRVSTVVSIHDCSYAAHPEWYPHSAGRLRQRFYRRSAEGATAVVTLSDFSRREIARVYRVPPGRIFPIALASGLEGVQAAPSWDRPAGLARYVLHVGDQHARRNLPAALAACRQAAGEAPLDVVLIGRDLGARGQIRARAAALGWADRVHFFEDVALAQLPHWYRNAAVLVYPSFYEGFGLPLLEAMQCGCPVVAARAASIPEVTGAAAWLVDPASVPEIAAALRVILSAPQTREIWVGRGIERSRLFSWQKTAEETARVYEHVHRGEVA